MCWVRFCFCIGILFCGTMGWAQHQLTGKILDGQTHAGLVGASIYFPELHRGVASSESGEFHISGLAHGKQLMQVSHVGYESFFMRIDLASDSSMQIVLKTSLIQMQEVIITGSQSQSPTETTFNVSQITREQMTQNGALSISDGVSRMPGVSQLTTGPGISKPVIRGLYGNRIQINVNGLRFDNQQWQDEHGLGLSDLGIDRVEVIRGPASVLYGSDAMGGVLNIIEEKPAPVNTEVKDFSTRLYSNTYGLSLNYGVKKSSENRWKKMRAGFDNHADYSDGNGNRVLNSRFASYNLKASWGRNKENSVHVFNLMASHSLFGFVFDSLSRKKDDGRLSRSFDGPHHIVSFAQASSENTYYKNKRKIKFNAGLISNLRLEDEGGGGISLAMLLNTINALGQITQPIGDNGEWTYGTSFMFQSNTNFGGRIIVPNAITGEASAFTFYKQHVNRWLLEGGLRYDRKFIGTFATSSLNVIGNDSPTQEILPFNNFYNAANFSVGAGYNFTEKLSIKFNGTTGYRPGNLAELSSNGLHEGTLRWEIGLPTAKIEQNLNLEGSLHYNTQLFRASASAYNNHFNNFLYLAPTGKEYYGFHIYHYEQTNATLQGGELMMEWNPFGSPVELSSSYSFIDAEKDDGSYLPFIPANKVMGEVKLHLKSSGAISSPVVRVGGNYFFDQSHPAHFETSTAGYFLLHAGATGQWKKISLSVVCNNLLNVNYYDHLSRFKYYGIANMGRNIVLGMNFKL